MRKENTLIAATTGRDTKIAKSKAIHKFYIPRYVTVVYGSLSPKVSKFGTFSALITSTFSDILSLI